MSEIVSQEQHSFISLILNRIDEIPNTQRTSIKKALDECEDILHSLTNSQFPDTDQENFQFLIARTLLLKASCNAEFRELDNALADIQKALEIFLEQHNKEYIVRALIVKANINAYQSNFTDSLELLENAYHYAVECNNAELKAGILVRKGAVHHSKGNHTQALELFYNALAFINEEQFPLAVSSCYNDIASTLTRVERLDEAEEYYNKAIALNRLHGNKRGLMRNVSDYGVLHFRRGNYELSLQYHLEALAYALEFGLIYSQGVSYSNLAAVYYNLRDLSQSIEYLKKSLDIYERNNDPYGMSICLSNIAIAQVEMNDYSDAYEFAEKALSVSAKIGGKEIEALNHNTLSLVHNHLHDYKQAIIHSQKSQQLYTEIGNRLSAGMAIFNEASSLVKLGNYEQAVHVFHTTLALGEEFDNYEFIIQSLVGIADALVQSLRARNLPVHNEEVLAYFRRAEEIIHSKQLHSHSFYKTLAEISEHLGNYQSALDYYKKAEQAQEQIRSGDAAKQVLTLKTERELANKEKERLIAESEWELARRDAEIHYLENVELAERNTIIKSQNEELIQKQNLLNISNEKLKRALTELAELGASRIARTIVMIFLFALFVLSEVLVDPLIATVTDSAIFGVVLRFAGGLLFRPIESYVEHLAIRKRKETILSIIKE